MCPLCIQIWICAAPVTTAEMHIEGASEEERIAQAALAKSERMQQVLSALAVLASSSGVASERQQFMALVKDEIGTQIAFC